MAVSRTPTSVPATIRDQHAVQLRGLAKSYGQTRAVAGIDLTLERGEVVALLGPNGAGKSTAIDMMLGLTRPDAGGAAVFGRTPAQAVAEGLVGGMLQVGGLIPDVTVGALVHMMASLYPGARPAADVLRECGVSDSAGRQATRLSGGQTQRVRFALAMVSNPALMVLDEPTVALDVEGRHDFWETMRGFAGQGRTVLFATHYLEEADSFADRVVLLSGGRIVADGAATQIKALVGQRIIRATLPGVATEELERLDGVHGAGRAGNAVTLECADSDAAIRALLHRYPEVRDIEIQGAGLEHAFRVLTGSAAGTPSTAQEMTR